MHTYTEDESTSVLTEQGSFLWWLLKVCKGKAEELRFGEKENQRDFEEKIILSKDMII